MALTLTKRKLFPVGNKMMALCEITGDTGGATDVGLTVVESVSVMSRGGNTDTAIAAAPTTAGGITFGGMNASATYLVQAIGV